MDMRKCKITFIAHGDTIHSEESRFYDTENYPPLSDLGTHEIEKICEYLKKRGIKNDCIYTSPSLRCIQSAEHIAKMFIFLPFLKIFLKIHRLFRNLI